MTSRAWLYFAAVSLIWGIPYLFIKIAVGELSPVVVVFARIAIGALVLLPFAMSTGVLRQLRDKLGKIVVLAAIEVIAPFMLIATGEQSISSSFTGILIATEPLMIALLATWLEPSERITGWRFAGLLLGLVGVAVALGLDIGKGTALGGSLMVLGASVAYGAGPLLVKRWFSGTSPFAVTTAILTISALVLLPPALFLAPHTAPSLGVVAALLVLGVVCTGLGFITFFALIGLAGAGRAGIITYVTPVVATLLGVGLRGEVITPAIGAGFALILAGSWLATGQRVPLSARARSSASPNAAAVRGARMKRNT